MDLETSIAKLENKDTMTTLVSNGRVDMHGRIADKRTTGGWKATPYIIVNEVAERLAFFAIAVNMLAYLVFEIHQSLPTAATNVNSWIGSAYVFTIVGAFLADAYLGRFKTIMFFSTIYALGMLLLTLSASVDSMRPLPCLVRPCKEASQSQTMFLYGSLILIAIGTGGIKPCVSSFGADQFDEFDKNELQKKYTFFNWFFFAINTGGILAITVLVYITDKKGYSWGFGIPTIAIVISIIVLASGIPSFRYQKPMGSPFTRFFQVMVASIRNHLRGVQSDPQNELFEVKTLESDIVGARKLFHTKQFRFLDKAAIIIDSKDTSNRWRLCTVTQVEEFKSFIRVLPIWVTTIALAISYAQLSTFFLSQARIMDRKLGPNFEIPTSSVPIFSSVSALVLVPTYEKLFVPILRKCTGNPHGLTSLQRMGVGLFVSIFAMVFAALVEKKRLDATNPMAMSVFWLFPQFFLIGSAEVFTYVGQMEFFYDEATDGTRSISNALFLVEFGLGNWISTALVKAIEAFTGREEKGWFKDDLNKSKLYYFYWILGAINAVNFLNYLLVAWLHKGKVNELLDVECVSHQFPKKVEGMDSGER